MTDRVYGAPPYRTIVLHGGPGAPGCAAGLCRAVEPFCGVIEHLQRDRTLDGLMEEILSLMDKYGLEKTVLTGHSYGAWLALLFAERYPERTEKLILIGCGPLRQEYLSDILRTRSERKKQGLDTDNYCALPGSSGDMLYFDEEQHLSLMDEITEMRKSGELLQRALRVQCPVTMIHGEYDPHPIVGSVGMLPGTKAYILPKCGHDPWKEKYARETFIRIMKEELT